MDGDAMNRDLIGRIEQIFEQKINNWMSPLADRIAALENEVEHLKATMSGEPVGRGLSPDRAEVDGALVADLTKAMVHTASGGFDSCTVTDQICRLIQKTGSSATRPRRSHTPAVKMNVEQFLANNEKRTGIPRAALLGALRVLAERNGGRVADVRKLQTLLDSNSVGTAIIEFNNSRKRPSSRITDEEPTKSHGYDQARETSSGEEKEQDAKCKRRLYASLLFTINSPHLFESQ